MSGEIRVIGMSHTPVVVADIGYIIPAGEIVAIPAESALSSKDLWRAINQQAIQRVTAVTPFQTMELELQRVANENAALKAENAELKARLEAIERRLSQ